MGRSPYPIRNLACGDGVRTPNILGHARLLGKSGASLLLENFRDHPFYMFRGSSWERYVGTDDKIASVKSLSQLRLLLSQDATGLEEYVHSKLKIGDMWWIPDEISHFGQKGRHPWVVVSDYSPKRPPVLACPRTSGIGRRKDELVTPANVLPTLDKEGAILLGFRRPFPADQFRSFEYIGRLPDIWVQRIRVSVMAIARGMDTK